MRKSRKHENERGMKMNEMRNDEMNRMNEKFK
jgi:hypothetical protein